MVEGRATSVASKVEVRVLHYIDGRLPVCGRLKDDLQHAFSGHDVGNCGDEGPRVTLWKRKGLLDVMSIVSFGFHLERPHNLQLHFLAERIFEESSRHTSSPSLLVYVSRRASPSG